MVTFWPVTAIVGGFVLLGAVFNPWALRQQAKSLGKTLHQRAEDDAIEVTVSADGVTSRQRGIAHRYGWAAFRGIERRGDHIFLLLRRGDPLLLPARVLNSHQMQHFDRLAAEHIGRSGEAA
ncbi:YcxB family protein [Bosea vestrisii]|uniref:YcxB family protein n=1 Tax=Bosea vestrisii TaxID=151416 RepID=UPI0024DF8059|nr:YcxB family protein [Bosea vestrisii]WID95876.1 YcxB family protein [Bosea vestrisii]